MQFTVNMLHLLFSGMVMTSSIAFSGFQIRSGESSVCLGLS